MINPAFCDVITLYHQIKIRAENGRTQTSWKRFVFRNCFFKAERVNNLENGVVRFANSYICRIPGTSADISPGDIVIKGIANDEISDVHGCRPNDVTAKYTPYCFTVAAVAVNNKIPQAAHIKLTGV